MGSVIGDLLPLAIGVAISPIPIITVILMLLSRQAAKTGTAFLIGWVIGLAAVTAAILALVGQAGNSDNGPSTISSVLKLVFGVLLLLLAVKQWRARPKDGEAGTMPKWMNAIDTFNFGKALGLGLLLSAANPKNLIMCLGAGTTIGAAHLSVGDDIIAVATFTVLGASTVAVPVVIYLSARDKVKQPLIALRQWLTQNNVVVMAVLLLVIGVLLIGKGISGLSS